MIDVVFDDGLELRMLPSMAEDGVRTVNGDRTVNQNGDGKAKGNGQEMGMGMRVADLSAMLSYVAYQPLA